jgi:hypothetical protein
MLLVRYHVRWTLLPRLMLIIKLRDMYNECYGF